MVREVNAVPPKVSEVLRREICWGEAQGEHGEATVVRRPVALLGDALRENEVLGSLLLRHLPSSPAGSSRRPHDAVAGAVSCPQHV